MALAVGLLFLLPGGPAWAQDAGTIEYPENGTDSVATYTAVDPEQTAIVSWSLGGDDAGDFKIDDGVLNFKSAPDFEAPKGGSDGNLNTYSVTVQATDSTSKVGTKEVMVEVANVEEPGKVTLSALRPQSATEFTATLTDPDGPTGPITTGVTWQWAKAGSKTGAYTDIEDAESGTYTPVDADINSYLRATASYTDGEGSDKRAMVVSDYAVQGVRGNNTAPEFAEDQDPNMDGDQTVAVRKVPENTPAGTAIGDPVVAEDKNGDVLTYTLTGNAASSFDINWATGQLMTKGAHFEGTPNYTVTVRATDPTGIPQADSAQPANSDTVEVVAIMVTDVNEPPAVTGDAAVTFQGEAGDITTVLPIYSEDNPEDNVLSTWSVTGTDAGKFEISTDGGLTFKAKPDFEKPGDANTDNVYEVTVVAADEDGNRGTMDVKVTVANEDEDGTVTLSKVRPRVGVAVKASLTDPDGSISGLTWQWSKAVSASTMRYRTPIRRLKLTSAIP